VPTVSLHEFSSSCFHAVRRIIVLSLGNSFTQVKARGAERCPGRREWLNFKLSKFQTNIGRMTEECFFCDKKLGSRKEHDDHVWKKHDPNYRKNLYVFKRAMKDEGRRREMLSRRIPPASPGRRSLPYRSVPHSLL